MQSEQSILSQRRLFATNLLMVPLQQQMLQERPDAAAYVGVPRAHRQARRAVAVPEPYLSGISKFCKFLAGSFSAVSKRNFARKYAFDSIFQALQDLHPFAPLQSQNFRKKSV